MALTQVQPGMLASDSQYTGFKNRIINGAMVIDQRNAGASITASTSALYSVDRWQTYSSPSSKFTVQQTPSATETGYATRVGAGFTNYLACTSSSAYTVTSSDLFFVQQTIEGFNTADLAFGTANAKTITISFWVYSSLTGSFGASLQNGANNRSYPFSYTISTANTWTQISTTIAGDTGGTWVGASNAGSMILVFSLGMGSTKSGTAGSWSGNDYRSVTGAVSVVGTNGATWYVTGVQLEKGSTATSFDYRPYGTELGLCYRYYEKSYEIGTVPGTSTYLGGFSCGGGSTGSTTSFIGEVNVRYRAEKRTTPTVTVYDPAGTSGVLQRWQLGVNNVNGQNATIDTIATTAFSGYSSGGSNSSGLNLQYTVSAEL